MLRIVPEYGNRVKAPSAGPKRFPLGPSCSPDPPDTHKVNVQSADESEEPQKEPARKKRRGYHGPARLKMESRTDFTVSAACHVMASLFKPMLFKLTKDFLDDDALILKVIGDFEAASAFLGCACEGGADGRAANR